VIKAVLFDLDGTLVQTEKLKALSYARAAVELCPHDLKEKEVIEAFKEVVGLSRRQVATRLMNRFRLEPGAKARMSEFGVNVPWQAYLQIRLNIYQQLLADPEILVRNQWPHAVALLRAVRERGCKTGLATMSHCEQTRRILEVLELGRAFDFVATRDDVRAGKPDPEIYLLVAAELAAAPEESLVIEDSPAGVEAALNAGMEVIAVSTPFTREGLYALERIPDSRIVDDPANLMAVVTGVFEEHGASPR